MDNFKAPNNRLTWVIGGAQGSGVDSAANIFSRACAQGGLHIFGKREYYSNIKGEHSYFTVRVSDNPIRSHVDEINILVSFDAETVFKHADKVTKGGAIIYDSGLVKTNINEVPTIDKYAAERIAQMLEKSGKEFTIQGMLNYAQDRGVFLYGISYFSLVKEFSQQINEPSLSKLTRMINVMALSASMAALNFDRDVLARAIRRIFKSKQKIAEINVAAADYAYNHMRAKYDTSKFPFNLNCKRPSSDILLIQGNQSSAMGKIVAGCRFQTYYPITPASDDSEFLESNQLIKEIDGNKGSIVVVQTEDEIAAIAMAIGGALTGVRAATATSGPGFSLMAEALGWAGINEVPLVVSLYQRAGPSTGLPTRHEQGDLLFAINAGHGEFPRIVFASGDIEESFYDTLRVFNFADVFQLPVIHLLDKAIASSVMTCKNFDPNMINIDRGNLITEINNKVQDHNKLEHFKRFELKENEPISARTPIGTENGIFWNTGDEHNEEGHIIEDPTVRIKMMNKRMNKLDLILQTIPDEDKTLSYNGNSDIVITSWGSTKGAILDTLDELNKEGIKIKFVQVKLLNPFPQQLLEKMLNSAKTIINIEMNYSSQLAKLIKQNLHRDVDYEIVKYNGRPISCDELHRIIKEIVNNNTDKRRIVLDYGT